jgi:hypothetical protein
MEGKRKSAISPYRSKFSILILIIEISYISSIFYILYTTTEDCSNPLRLWLEVLFLIFSSHFVFALLTSFPATLCPHILTQLLRYFSSLVNFLLCLFMVFWISLGNYWYYDPSLSCVSFPEGESAVFTILLIYYIFLGCGCCAGCTMLVLTYVGRGITTMAADY